MSTLRRTSSAASSRSRSTLPPGDRYSKAMSWGYPMTACLTTSSYGAEIWSESSQPTRYVFLRDCASAANAVTDWTPALAVSGGGGAVGGADGGVALAAGDGATAGLAGAAASGDADGGVALAAGDGATAGLAGAAASGDADGGVALAAGDTAGLAGAAASGDADG